jgi:DUF2075 family protein/predicted GIY-YIG superfamily endonuclease
MKLQSLFEKRIFQSDSGIPNEKNLFEIVTKDFTNLDFDRWDVLFDYHCAYILENGREAYIGESKDVERRLGEHLSKSERNRLKKYRFNKIHIFTGRLAEIGMAKYQENQLIILMRLDGKFKIVNDKDGETQRALRKNLFEWYFDKLWPQLVKKGLVNARTFKLIINSTAYKYSPYTELTEKQQFALDNIVNVITSKEKYDTRPILVCGDAGTGKTVLATSLFYYLKNDKRFKDKKIALVYANPATRSEIGVVFKNTDGLRKKDVVSPIAVTKQHFDIVICDEAHKLRQGKNLGLYYKYFKNANKSMGMDDTHNELDWILEKPDYQILLYDEKQRTSSCDIPHERFEQTLLTDHRGIRLIPLEEQMRIKAGDEYVDYVFDILNQSNPEKKVFPEYDFKLFTSMADMEECLDSKEREAGLSRYCAGYAWLWLAKDDVSLFDISIDGVGFQWNKQTAGWLSNLAAKKEMGSIYTLPGLDLNYTAVVFGPEIYLDPMDNMIKIDRNKFVDNKVKSGVPDDELKTLIINTYGVFLTRGIMGTYVYVCDDNLKEYLSKYIPHALS